MLIAIWDFFFTRRQWTIIKEIGLRETPSSTFDCQKMYILQDQFGNIKKKRVRF